MTFRHFLKQILQPLPGFAGLFQRRERLREQGRTIETMRAALAQAAEERKQAEEQKWQAVREREQAEAAKWEAIRQREQAEEARWQAVREREQADELKVQAIRERDQLAAVRAEAEAAKHLQWKDVPQLEKQGLFVVGHARAGTTALMHALNSCPDIFLLGEANLFVEGLKPAFAHWYNQMHGQDGKPNTKDSYCPLAPDGDANGVETLHWLSQRFRYVGEKVAFRSESLGYNPRGFFDFHARNFFLSHYVCVIRNPADVLKSNRDMFKPQDLSVYADSYLQSLELVLALNDTMPNVYVLFHESINQHAFDVIGEKLGVNLSGFYAANYHAPYQVVERHEADHERLPSIATLNLAYRKMRDAFSPQTLREQPHHPQWMILAESIKKLREELAAPGSPKQSAVRVVN